MTKSKSKDFHVSDPRKSRLYLAVRAAEGDLTLPDEPTSIRARLVKSGASLLGVKLEKAQRSVTPRFIFETAPTILEPPHNQIALFDLFMRCWVTRQILRAIRQEVLGAGVDEEPWTVEPRFVKKCTKCGKEYDTEVDTCDDCDAKKRKNITLRDPDENERFLAERLIKQPNLDYNFFSLLSSTISYSLSLDDFYWSIAYGQEFIIPKDGSEPHLEKRAREIYVEDSRFIRPVADGLGHLGNDEYFCPVCYDPKTDQPMEKLDLNKIRQGKIPECPKCKGPLIQTCWVQAVGSKIYARLGRDEIVHGSSERVLPDLFGNPKLLSVVKLAETLGNMDEYNLGVYSEGKVGSVVAFPGMEQDAIDSMLSKAERAIQKKEKEDLQSGKLIARKKIRTVFLGVKEKPERLPIMEDFEKMQSLEFYKTYAEKICGLFGVTPVFVSIIESGKSGNNPRMQIDVQDHTTREQRRLFESVINEQVFPIFKIHDWVWRFGSIQQRDELREAQIGLAKAQTANAWVTAGFKVSLDEHGDLEVSGEASPQPPPSEEGAKPPGVPTSMPSMPSVSEASGDLLEQKDIARLPISWYDASKLEYDGHTYALNNDKDTVTLLVDNVRIEGVWSTLQLGDSLGALLSKLFSDVQAKMMIDPGFDRLSFESQWNNVVTSYRRNLETGAQSLLQFCQNLDNMNMKQLAQTLDEWRERISKLKPSTLEGVS